MTPSLSYEHYFILNFCYNHIKIIRINFLRSRISKKIINQEDQRYECSSARENSRRKAKVYFEWIYEMNIYV